jgi:hypothetical protein
VKRKIELVLDGDGDVIMVRVDHHSPGAGGRDIVVDWGASKPTPGASVVTLTYQFPRKKAK